MAMGMGSNKKRSSSSAGVVAWCIILGLALLIVEAAAKDASYCENLCRGRPYLQYIHCLDVCMLSPGHGAAARLAGHRRAAGLLAMPAERAGREEEEKRRQEDAGHLAETHGDAAYCSAFCNGRLDFGPCYNECLYGRVTGQEEARGAGSGVGGRAGLLAMPTERAGREGEEKGKQADAVLHLSDPVWCYDACRDQKVMPEEQCVRECYDENMPDAAWLAAHGGVGGVDALTAAAGRLKYSRCRGFVDCSVKPCVWRCMRGAGGESTQHEDEETRGGAVDVPMAAGALSFGNCDEYCRKHYDVGSPGYRHCQHI